MSCYHPLKAFPIGTTPAGKQALKIVGYETDHVEFCNGKWQASHTPMASARASKVQREFIEIPCGQCIGCRLEYSRQWANRCLLELQYHDSAYFVTLTYDNDHVPFSCYGSPDSGEAFDALTLRKRDFQLFMKRLRKAFPDDKIRFYAAGEYGEDTFRPHYHAIIYGLHLRDLVLDRPSLDGKHNYYASKELTDIWKNGAVVVANVSWETCAYTARYVTKKLNGKAADFYDLHNIEREFSLMSRKPGIGAQYFEDHPDCMNYEYINVRTDEGGKKFRPPKYYDRLFDIENPGELEKIKKIRKQMAEDAKDMELTGTSLRYIDYLGVKDRAKKAQVKVLKRSVI